MRIHVPATIPFDYEIRNPGTASHLYLLLHGYAQAGKVVLERVVSTLPEGAAVIAPNGPFPMPEKRDGGYRVGHSWYFYDPSVKDYFIDMAPAIEFVSAGLRKLGYEDTPKTIIGFSQGGYLAPILGQKLRAVSQVVGIGSEFLPDELSGPVHFQVDGICGDRDTYFTAEEARKADEALRARGVRGRLHVLPGVGHEINDEVRAALRRILIR